MKKTYYLFMSALITVAILFLIGVTMQITKSQSNSSPYASQDNELAAAQGWTEEAETRTWTFTSANAGNNAFVVTVDEDITSFMRPSLRVRAKQGGAYQYFIVHDVVLDTTNTLVTLFGGTDYDLSAGVLTDVAWSAERFPYGFPVEEDKWVVEVVDSSLLSQSSPTIDAWYNLLSISIPKGLWNVNYQAFGTTTYSSSVSVNLYSTLSTLDNTQGESTLTDVVWGVPLTDIKGNLKGHKQILLSSETQYYLNFMTSMSSTSFAVFGNKIPTVIRAVSGYY